MSCDGDGRPGSYVESFEAFCDLCPRAVGFPECW